MRLFGREDEMTKLAGRIQARRSFLFHGPAGVGKSRLLDELPASPQLLRVSRSQTPQAMFLEIGQTLWRQRWPELRQRYDSEKRLKQASAADMKAMCLSALRSAARVLVLEHVGFSSQQLSAAAKQLAGETGLPLIFVTRSCHMEDAGHLVRHYPDRLERLELSNFGSARCAQFTTMVAGEAGLEAENRAEFLARVAELSKGNPGAILAMVRMACAPKYRSGNWIKSSPLYIDFRLARNASL